MTATRRLLLAAAAVLPLALVACDNKCPTSSAKISQVGGVPTGVPTCSGIQAGATVQVSLGVCPRCDQAYDACTYTPPAGDAILQLDPLVQTCDANPSCPVNPSCNPVTCTFKAPAAGNYTLLVVDPDLGPIEKTFTVVGSGGATSCGV